MPENRLSLHSLVVPLLCLLAFAFSAEISRVVFERLPHLEDEYAYTFQARTIARGDLVIEQPQPRRAYWQPFVVDEDGLRFSKYTPGWGLLLATGTLMGQEWVVNAFLAALTVALVYAVGRDLFGRDVGLIAAALTTFSPMALLLNATLMGHTSAMFMGVLALWAYLRLERAITIRNLTPRPPLHRDGEGEVSVREPGVRSSLVFAVVCGVALGMLAANRPLTAIAFALPLMVRALANGWETLRAPSSSDSGSPLSRFASIRSWLAPHLVIAVATLAIAAIIPLYNNAAVGSPTANLYELVWEYDCVGFEVCGRSGHTLEKAFRHTRYDLSLTAADLFGWQLGGLSEDSRAHLLTDSDYYPQIGISWILLPLGVLIGLRRRWWLGVLWAAGIAAAYQFAMTYNGGALLTNTGFAWAWVIGAIGATVLPILFLRDRRISWTWILFAIVALLIGVQLLYWIGSQRYSTRYYFEGVAAAAILSAIPLAEVIKRFGRKPAKLQSDNLSISLSLVPPPLQTEAVEAWEDDGHFYGGVVGYAMYGVLAVVLLSSLINFSLPRLDVLRGYNQITRAQIDEVNARRVGDTPVLVLVTGGDVRWRAYGALMASTSPYLDSPIVAAWDYSNGTNPEIREEILARFPDRQVIEMTANVNEASFVDEAP